MGLVLCMTSGAALEVNGASAGRGSGESGWKDVGTGANRKYELQ